MFGWALQEFNHLSLVWVVSLSVIAVIWPRTILGIVRPCIFGSLAGSMLGMGRALGIEDFRRTGNILVASCSGDMAPVRAWLGARGVMRSIRDARPQ